MWGVRLRRDQRQQEGIGTRVVGRGRNPDGTWKKSYRGRESSRGTQIVDRAQEESIQGIERPQKKKTSACVRRNCQESARLEKVHLPGESPRAWRKSARLEKVRSPQER